MLKFVLAKVAGTRLSNIAPSFGAQERVSELHFREVEI